MDSAITFILFISLSILGITSYSIYSAFGPSSKFLTDPFEEHED